jgi:hypothetical protein
MQFGKRRHAGKRHQSLSDPTPDQKWRPIEQDLTHDAAAVDPGLVGSVDRVPESSSPLGPAGLEPPVWPYSTGEAISDAVGQEQSPFNLKGATYGEPTTIGREAWFSDRGWWKVPTHGESNDVRTHLGTVGDVAVAATSLRGHRHRLKGEPNQDSFALRAVHLDTDPNEPWSFLIAAVCDGVGSSENSAFGARLVAHQITEILAVMVRDRNRELFSSLHEFNGRIMAKITKAVTDYRRDEFDAPPIDASQINIKSLQTTLTFAVVPAFVDPGSTTRTAMIGSVGDSPALVLTDSQWNPVIADEADDGVWDTSTQGALGAPGLNLTPLELSAGMGLLDRKSTRLNSSHVSFKRPSRMPSSA